MKIQRILETALYVDDLHAAEAFYSGVLGLQVFTEDYPRHVFFRCGDGMLLLFDPKETLKGNSLPPHGGHGSQHIAFSIPPAELDEWKLHLEKNGVEIQQEVHWPNGARSLYFHDPAGNELELTSPTLWNLEK